MTPGVWSPGSVHPCARYKDLTVLKVLSLQNRWATEEVPFGPNVIVKGPVLPSSLVCAAPQATYCAPSQTDPKILEI